MAARLLATACIALLLGSTEARAQGQCDGGGFYFLFPNPRVVVATTPTPADLDVGEVDAGTVDVIVFPIGAGSRNWELCIRAVDPTMGGTGKPSSDVEFWPPGGSAWQPATQSDQLVASGSGWSIVQLRFRVRVDWSDDPGSYSSAMAITAGSS